MTKSFTPGVFVWRELITDDAAATTRFYGELFGWKIKEADMGGGAKYYLVNLGEKQIAGFWPKDAKHAMIPTHWSGYVSVENVDAAVSAATAAGGKILAGPMDIPNVGRFATIQDPQGATTNAFTSAHGDMPVGRPGVGEFCWESLATSDVKAALAFYEKIYGWKTKEVAPGMSVILAGEHQVASYMQTEGGLPTHWGTYVAVANLNESSERAKRLGGKVIVAEIPVPGFGKFAVLQDNVGAMIHIFEPAVMS